MTLIEAVQTTIRRLLDSPRTEEAYLQWMRAFIRFHGGRHPRDTGAPEATGFLNHLVVQRRVSASTQNQALCALVFLSRCVLGLEIMVRGGKGNHDRAAFLAARAGEGLRAQLREVERQHRAELGAGRGEVDLPHALRA